MLMNTYHVIGLMSGTSLDGLDIAYCRFKESEDTWTFEMVHADCVAYNEQWKQKLSNAPRSTALDLALLHVEYGHFLGNKVKEFIEKHKANPVDVIASHGHTVFHQPEKKLTLQIGSGAAIASVTGIKTVADFRTTDVLLGGQGAPLVPIGDVKLFSKYDYCLNIGGIANMSFDQNRKRVAYDICPANMVLNELAKKEGKEFDEDGALAKSGTVNAHLLAELNKLAYYQLSAPKSLGREWVEEFVFPLIRRYDLTTADQLATLTEHISEQIAINCKHSKNLLITGGGAFNGFLVERIRAKLEAEVIIPDDMTMKFKEALIFAFLGVLRLRNEVNCLASVTGASRDSIGGVIYE